MYIWYHVIETLEYKYILPLVGISEQRDIAVGHL